MFFPIGLIWKFLEKIAPDLVRQARKLGEIERYRFLSHVCLPAFILGTAFVTGGWETIGYEREVTVSELKTEFRGNDGASWSKRGVVIIVEPVSSKLNYRIPLANNSGKIWSSLDEESAYQNIEDSRLGLNARKLLGNHPLITNVNEPIVLVLEGDLGSEITIPGDDTELLDDWRLSSKHSRSLVVGVMINCALVLGIGAVTGFPFVEPNENKAGQIGAKPNEG